MSSFSSSSFLSNIGLGYSIAIALGFLFLLSTLILSSYLCCRASRSAQNPTSTLHTRPGDFPDPDGVVLPRIIFVAEDQDGDLHGNQNDLVLGLGQNVINSYPRFHYAKTHGEGDHNNSTCSICLCEYKESEMLRMMPECRHFFHLACLDAWLKLNGSCPVCRNSPLPTPLSTPLQEVVPLSHYAADRRRRT